MQGTFLHVTPLEPTTSYDCSVQVPWWKDVTLRVRVSCFLLIAGARTAALSEILVWIALAVLAIDEGEGYQSAPHELSADSLVLKWTGYRGGWNPNRVNWYRF